MAGVLRVSQILPTATDEDVKSIFQSVNIQPLDVHWVLNNYGKRSGTVFVSLHNKDLRKGTTVNGMMFRGQRVGVHSSSHTEFNTHFPSQPMVRGDTDWRKNPGYTTRNGSINPNHVVVGNARNSNYFAGTTDSYNYSSGFSDAANYVTPPTLVSFNGRQNVSQSDYRSKKGRNDFYLDNQDTRYSNAPKAQPPPQSLVSPPRRSRSPHDKRVVETKSKKEDNKKEKSSSSKAKPKSTTPSKDTTEKVNDKKYVRIFGMSFASSADDFKKFLKPIEVKEVYLLKFKSGDNAGKLNGSAIIELRKEENAAKALGYDGKNFNSKPIQVVRTAKEDIITVLEERKKSTVLNADLNTLNTLANSNPQIQRLLGLLNDAVADATSSKDKKTASSSSTPSSATSKSSSGKSRSSHPSSSSHHHKGGDRHSTSTSSSSSQRHSSSRSKEDPVINRVASSANINVDDIKERKVVGLRNLPSHVSTDMILNFFAGYKRIDESVRIHYLESGRCSGDAIIAFRTTEEARRAVQNLNKKSVEGRKIELFFL